MILLPSKKDYFNMRDIQIASHTALFNSYFLGILSGSTNFDSVDKVLVVERMEIFCCSRATVSRSSEHRVQHTYDSDWVEPSLDPLPDGREEAWGSDDENAV